MSDTAIAIVVVPFLIVLTLALECTRIGCVWLQRSYRMHKDGLAGAEAREGRRHDPESA